LSAPTPARRAAYETLRRVFEDGAWADRALRSAASRFKLAGRERAQAQALAYGAVQRRGTNDHFAAMLADRPVDRIDPPLLAALRLGLFELLYASGDADHAAVDQAVSLAKGRGAQRRGAGMVNAVLRRAARERVSLLDGLDDADPQGAAIAHSVPVWLAELWWDELGADSTRSLLGAINDPPERALRVNRFRGDRDSALAALRSRDLQASVPDPDHPPAPSDSLIVTGGDRGRVEELIGDGTLIPQSRASTLVVDLLAAQPGERVLDLCAGPGIKASQIAASLGAQGAGLVAVERAPGRARELEELLSRLGATAASVECADASGPRTDGQFDAVLVDPPCSGLGTLASRPDSRWRRSPEAIVEMAELAGRILERALAAVTPGGRVIYSTCTISSLENESVVGGCGVEPDDLTQAMPSVASLAAATDGRFLQTRIDRDRTDGFFIARLRC
jgi:16S rRNA (cytosine967-C5)-methyltransferase